MIVYIGNLKQIFGVYYRANVSHVDELELLRDELSFISANYPGIPIVLTGDFNLPDICWGDGVSRSIYRQDEYLELFSIFGLTQVVDKPTRGDKILDIILVSEVYSILKVENHPPLSSCDHDVVECVLHASGKIKSNPDSRHYCWARAKWSRIKLALAGVNWWDVFLAEDLSDVDILWRKFKSQISEIIADNVPQYTRASYDKKSRLSKRTYAAVRTKRIAHRRYRRSNCNADKVLYRSAVRAVGSSLARDKIVEERNIAARPNSGKFFKFINSKLKYKQSVASLRVENGTVTTEGALICDSLNTYFQSVFSNLPEAYPEYNRGTGLTMDDLYITNDDIVAAIMKCPDKCSSGCDDIPSIFYKRCVSEISFPLQIIFTQTLENRCLPKEWLVSRVSPIHKKGSKLAAENYRPSRVILRLPRNSCFHLFLGLFQSF